MVKNPSAKAEDAGDTGLIPKSGISPGDGQGGLGCCDSWGCKEADRTVLLNDKWLICSSHHHTVFSYHTTCPCSTFLLPYIFLIIYGP